MLELLSQIKLLKAQGRTIDTFCIVPESAAKDFERAMFDTIQAKK
jgi:hypothetical protein